MMNIKDIWSVWWAVDPHSSYDEEGRPYIIYDNLSYPYDCLKVTSKPKEDRYQLKYWKESGFLKLSYVRFEKIVPLCDNDFKNYVGTLKSEDIIEIYNRANGYCRR